VRAFKTTEGELEPGCRVIRVEGELDLAVAERLRQRLDQAALDDVEVVIGLEECDFLDSTGIAVILTAHRLLREKGRSLVVYGAREQVLRILSLTGLTEHGLVVETAAEAVAGSRPAVR
jgi:anti-anti-sigma factor